MDYEPLPVIVDPHKSMEAGAFVLRPDRGPDKQTDRRLALGNRATWPPPTRPSPAADVTVSEDVYIPRIHVASIETCGCVADWNAVRGQLTLCT